MPQRRPPRIKTRAYLEPVRGILRIRFVRQGFSVVEVDLGVTGHPWRALSIQGVDCYCIIGSVALGKEIGQCLKDSGSHAEAPQKATPGYGARAGLGWVRLDRWLH